MHTHVGGLVVHRIKTISFNQTQSLILLIHTTNCLFYSSQTLFRYNNGEKVDFDELGAVNTVANALKSFFRDLRTPLLTCTIFNEVLKVTKEKVRIYNLGVAFDIAVYSNPHPPPSHPLSFFLHCAHTRVCIA